MRYYLHVIKRILIYNASSLLALRSTFTNSILSGAVWSISSVITVLLLTSKAGSVYGWSREELILLTGTYTITWGIANLLFQRNFQDLALIIDRGNLDMFLLKPIDSQFLVSLKHINYAGISRLIIGSMIISTMTHRLHLTISFFHFLIFLILIILGVVVIYSLWFMIVTILIWNHSLTNLNAVANNIIGYSRYPQQMYEKVSPLLVTIIPTLITASIPTRFLLNKMHNTEIIFLFMTSGITLLLSRKFWQFALRSYTSAGG